MTKSRKQIDSIYHRQSVRTFEKKGIPKQILYDIIRAGTMAPASGNMQPWEFIVIDDERMKEKVAEQTFSGFYAKNSSHQGWITHAGVILVVCTNFKRTVARYGSLAYKWAPLDTASSVQNMLLTATELGLAGCWVGGFRESELKQLLHIPNYVQPVGLVPIGFPRKELAPAPKQKISPEWVTHNNGYNEQYFSRG